MTDLAPELIEQLLSSEVFNRKLNSMMTDRLRPVKDELASSKQDILQAIAGLQSQSGGGKKKTDEEDEEKLTMRQRMESMETELRAGREEKASLAKKEYVQGLLKKNGLDRTDHAYYFIKDSVSLDKRTGKYLMKYDGFDRDINDAIEMFAQSDDGLVYKSASATGGTGGTATSDSKTNQKSEGNDTKKIDDPGEKAFQDARAKLISYHKGDYVSPQTF